MLNISDFWSAAHRVFSHAPMQVLLTLLLTVVAQLIVHETIGLFMRQVVRGGRYANKTDASKREKTLVGIFRTASSVLLWLVAIVVILGQVGVNIAAFMTGAGILGVVVGFGAQSTIKDFLAGLFIIVENQYRVGDLVTLRAVGTELTGVVEDLTVRITKIRDMDGSLHIIPNGTSLSVTNLSFGYANVYEDFVVDYRNNVDEVRTVVNRVGADLATDAEWRKLISAPIRFLRVQSFSDTSLSVKVHGRVAPGSQWEVAGVFRERLIAAFKREGIVVVHDEAPDEGQASPKQKRRQ